MYYDLYKQNLPHHETQLSEGQLDLNKGQGVRMTFDATNKKDNLRIEYELVDNSFDHEFGTCVRKDYEWTKIEVYVEAIDDWLDLTHTSDERILNLANKLLEEEMMRAA